MSLIQEHESIVHKISSLYADTEDQKADLRQEILLQGWHSFKSFRGEAAFSTWLYKVALNTALAFRKKETKQRTAKEVAPSHHDGSTNHSHSELLYTIIKSLNDIDRMLITMHLDGYKNKEIAEITGMTANNTTVKLHRIKAVVIDKFKKMNNE